MRRMQLARIVAIAASTVVLVAATTAPAVASSTPRFHGPLTDLQPEFANPTDGAYARARATELDGKTIVRLQLAGLDHGHAGLMLGAHVHVGPCVEGDGAAALGHYNTGDAPSARSEVWLDFTIRSSGVASSLAIVPFTIPPGGAHSIVIHAMSTAPDGAAGARLACLPIEF